MAKKKQEDSPEPIQFSLALFDSKPDILKKPVQAVHIAVAKGVLSKTQRVAFNVMLKSAHDWHAEHPNENRDLYEISRVSLMEAINYSSPNRKHLKATLKQMQHITVEWDLLQQDGGKKWLSTVLLPEIGFDDDKVYYSYSNSIKPMLLASKTWAILDIGIQRQFRLDASAALYEWCARFRNNPSKLTTEMPWEQWRWVIHGAIDDDSVLNEYKYFKKRKLQPAIAEINTISDLEIELIEKREGKRRITNLQFKVKVKAEVLEVDLPETTDPVPRKTEWEQKLKDLKVPPRERARILANYSEAVVEAHYAYTMDRISDRNQEKVQHPGKYFIRAIDEGYANADVEEQKPATQTPASLNAIEAAFNKERTDEAKQMFAEMTDDQKTDMLNAYNSQVSEEAFAIPEAAAKRNNRHMVPFYVWLARETWPEPSAQELMEFAISKGLITLNLK